jgi:anti-anti-sigma factor
MMIEAQRPLGGPVERYAVRAEHDGVVVAEGDLDLAAVPAVRTCLEDPTVTTFDLAAVTFIDSSVIAVLLSAHRERAGTGPGLLLRAPSEHVRRVLRLSGADRWIPVDPA